MNQNPADAYYLPAGEGRYRPTAHTGGAWNTAEQHFSPLGGLIVHAIDEHCADRGLVPSRIGFDILGRLPLEEYEIRVRTVRPGRTIELVEAEARSGGRTAVRARAWLLAPGDTAAVAGGAAGALPDPEELKPRPLGSLWPGGYIASLDVRPVGTAEPGRATVWLSSDLPLVQGRTAGPLASFVALIDTANGIAVREAPTEWMFPNVDLTVHLHRQPRGRWVGLDTEVVFGPTGQGLTSTVLHDRDGEVGRAQQILTVRPLTSD
ncbi:thioesterase family protein [Nocardiopsis composta]|uniref:Acyl-CoA thioesterase n=1 Tax=Nocardiopsis composta TaxID=157465 RepID=A0A7W8VCG1_9ACTN|nr:thioesterase family protein [Nocardiopsis composta]MBB5431157.1 acyl-CoA thioesterase [Nocardiopsis composta]